MIARSFLSLQILIHFNRSLISIIYADFFHCSQMAVTDRDFNMLDTINAVVVNAKITPVDVLYDYLLTCCGDDVSCEQKSSPRTSCSSPSVSDRSSSVTASKVRRKRPSKPRVHQAPAISQEQLYFKRKFEHLKKSAKSLMIVIGNIYFFTFKIILFCSTTQLFTMKFPD